jgi:hypothetical protein
MIEERGKAMTNGTAHASPAEVTRAHEDGRREGMAIAALAVAMIAFLNLLGAEKSILAAVLAVLAMSGSRSKAVRQRSLIAIGLAMLHIATIVIVLVFFWEELGHLVQSLNKLG